MKGNGLSDREAALIAAARRESGLRPQAAKATAPRVVKRDAPAQPVMPPSPQPSAIGATPSTPTFTPQAPTEAPPKPDIATRMALLMEAERAALQERKSRIKRNYMIGISAVLVPSFLQSFQDISSIRRRGAAVAPRSNPDRPPRCSSPGTENP